ncbi:Ubiquitin-protein ligase E3C [Lamellibrachia satsuma]|nr:Ubiquitin-protein ligase E3C [Lamellibrachia satsuma]
MYSFEGDFRRKPVQALGGVQKKEHRDALIERRQEERREREQSRRQQQSAVIIQAFCRASTVRKKQYAIIRQAFDQLCQQSQHVPDEMTTLSTLVRYLLFFYSGREDVLRLTWLCQKLLKGKDMVAEFVCREHIQGVLQIKKLLSVCCCHIANVAANTGKPIAVPLRMLEVFAEMEVYMIASSAQRAIQVLQNILLHLINQGYYKCMRALLEGRIPASLEQTVAPPTPFAASILELVKKPVMFARYTNNAGFQNAALQSLCRELFCHAYSEQTQLFLLPALAHAGPNEFPVVFLLPALVPFSLDSARNAAMGEGVNPEAWELTVEASPWLLWAVLILLEKHLTRLSQGDLNKYLLLLSKLIPQLQHVSSHRQIIQDDFNSDDDDDDDFLYYDNQIQQQCLEMVNQPDHVKALIACVTCEPSPRVLMAVCVICHTLMVLSKLAVHRTRLLYTLAFNPFFLRQLWHTCISVTRRGVTGTEVALLQLISRASVMMKEERNRIVPLLSLFCSLFSHSLLSLHDAEFYGDNTDDKSFMPFQVGELVPMSLALRDTCLGIIELVHPDTKPSLKEDYKEAFQSVGIVQNTLTAAELQDQQKTWAYVFKVTVQLVKHLYARDSRRPFCPPGHWLARQVNINADKPSQLYKAQNMVFVRRSFGALSTLNPKKVLDDDCPPLSTTEVRHLTILTELPFVVSFEERVKIFRRLVLQERMDTQDNEPNLRLRMQVQLINFAGLDEAGIDGGGIFREFMTELIRTSFDPNRGFFRYTHDKLLYPNPDARLLFDNYLQHYFFLGRILGKALFENMLIELPFASFFLSKILSRHRGDVDIHHLASLDPQMYKNLLFLKSYDGDMSELGLDFTVVNNELGEAQMEELKPGGRDIAVTNNNVIEYIHLMADYRLNKQMRAHCTAFRQGLADVLNIEWLRMFDHNEVQVLISGAVAPIDIEDLQHHTNYSGAYTVDHPVIKMFWKVVESFTNKQKRQLLKFVTSCSRPPLLGFRELYPAFCVHHGGDEADRLPSASTCMNLLKLPEFQDEETLRSKLVYAIESGAGFELS